MKKVLVYGTAVLSLVAAPLFAQQPGSGTAPRTPSTGTTRPAEPAGGSPRSTPQADMSKAANPDHAFVMEAAMGGMAEVELGRLASDKAQSPEVKQFGERMATDHGKANDELKTLAQNKNITLPTDLDAKHMATKDRLSKLSGAAFDRAYMQEMVSDHRKDVSEFQKESKSGKDPDVKAWAAKTLPTLQEHMQLAQAASRSAVGTSGTASPTPRGGDTSTPGGANPPRMPSPTPDAGNPNAPRGTAPEPPR